MRSSGILMPIFSLPSKYGIGTLGREAYRFIDFLHKSGQSYWQMLPIGPTGFGDSPYQSFSVFAGNPYFIDLDMLCEMGLLKQEELDKVQWCETATKVDYARLFETRFPVFRLAYERFSANPPRDFSIFCRFHASWLEDYALFMAIKDSKNGCSFDRWEHGLKFRDPMSLENAKRELQKQVDCYRMLQYLFYHQWMALKTYAKNHKISLIGDIPIYTALDSCDVWSHPELFQLDDERTPTAVAGCPPDAFSAEGQLWGNPLYDWNKMAQDHYSWWSKRIKNALDLFDVVRIDHFRGFSAFYSIPFGDSTAEHGQWIEGPGKALFDQVSAKADSLPIIAEDLGKLDEKVRTLLHETGFPGMAVLQFAFDPHTESNYLPHNIRKHCVVYTGTHDNDTALGFLKDGDPNEVQFAKDYLFIEKDESFNWAMIRAAMATPAEICILQMQDFLGLDNSARINVPSTQSGNWTWRIDYSCLNDWLAEIIHDCTATYFRLP